MGFPVSFSPYPQPDPAGTAVQRGCSFLGAGLWVQIHQNYFLHSKMDYSALILNPPWSSVRWLSRVGRAPGER